MEKPNILFVTAEDMCPNLGCYGDDNAMTPNLDKFSNESIRFTNVFSVHPCCSPSRSCLATGIYPTRLGTFQHRGVVSLEPEDVRTLTSLLKDDGYYTFNGLGCEGGRAKQDYNFRPQDNPWDIWNSQEWEWQNRNENQPFFGQVNFMQTHQSQYGLRQPGTGEYTLYHPNDLTIPDYHPDVPAVREIWCEYYERISLMDEYFGKLMMKLEEDNLHEDTIVIFLGDNGMGIPSGKVWTWEQGLHVPLMIRVPDKYKHLIKSSQVAVNDDLVSFLDFAPTVLSWCGIEAPDKMQGITFLQEETRNEIYAARDLHEAANEDFSRVVRTKDYHYIRNYMPHIGWEAMPYTWGQAPFMMEEWYSEALKGTLDIENRTSCFFIDEKPFEELYDIHRDPMQMHNLSHLEEYEDILKEMRRKCEDWIIDNCDLGFLSQTEMYKRSQDIRTYNLALDSSLNPIKEMLEVANIANERDIKNLTKLKKHITHSDSAVQRWVAIALVSFRKQSQESLEMIYKLLNNESLDVKRICAEYILSREYDDKAFHILKNQLTHENGFVRYHALLSLTRLGDRAVIFDKYLDSAIEPCVNRDWGSGDPIPQLVHLVRENYFKSNQQRYKVIPVMHRYF